MKKNVGTLDKAIRVLIAIIAFYLAYTNQFGTTVSYILYAVAAIMVVVALVGFCPLYPLLGLNSSDKKKE